MPKTIITIHGVGRPDPGEIACSLADGLGVSPAEVETVHIEGHTFTKLIHENTGDQIFEVSWSDLVPRSFPFLSVFLHLWNVITSMVDVAARKINDRVSICVPLYRIALFPLSLGVAFLTVATGILLIVSNHLVGSILLFFLTILSVFSTIWAQKYSKQYRLLWIIVIIIGLLLCSTAFSLNILSASDLASLTIELRKWSFLATVLLAFVSLGECWVRWRRNTLESRLAHMAFIYMPFVALNILMTWGSFLTTAAIDRFVARQGSSQWETLLLSGTSPKDVAQIEFATTLTFATLGFLLFAVPVGCYFLSGLSTRSSSDKINRKGRSAQNGVVAVLIVSPLLLVLLAVYCLWVNISHQGILPVEWMGPNLSDIYKVSILRTAPYLLWFVRPFGIVLDVIADIILYVQPDLKHPAAIAKKCQDRLQLALSYVEKQTDGDVHEDHEILLLAHSQGSVIAADVCRLTKVRCRLLTVGSPVQSLYARFLAISTNTDHLQVPWLNCFRDGDYVAGPIKGNAVQNINLGSGGHTNYWKDARLKEYVELIRGRDYHNQRYNVR